MASARGKSISQGPFCRRRSPPQRNLGFEGWQDRQRTASVQVTANVTAAVKTTAGIAVAAPEGAAVASPTSIDKAAAVQTAAATPAVGSKPGVPSILALLNSSASSKVGPSGTEVAKNVALQGDGASQGEVNPEGLEV